MTMIPTQRSTLAVTLLACSCALVGCGSNAEDSDPGSSKKEPLYLALGDSIAFGWSPLVSDQTQTDQFQGYPEKTGQPLELALENAACPGEATTGFISETGADNGCRKNRAEYGLHVDYEGTQLDFALETLAAHPETELVTVTLGGNDLSMLNDQCAGDGGCLATGLPVTLDLVKSNLTTIFSAIREQYSGPLAFVNYYAFDYNSVLESIAISALNSRIKEAGASSHVIIADGFSAFQKASTGTTPCDAGLLAKLPDGTCDRHPSSDGQALLSQTLRSALDASK
jgi:lysophospholipase L1-like esterase